MKSSESSSSPFSISSSSSVLSNPFGLKTRSFGRISAILRKVFCSGNLPTFPSDQHVDSNLKFCDLHQESESKDVEGLGGRGYGPGVVARLMGLDSMPETDSGYTRILRESITRSRSMNSADCFRKESDQLERRHRRVKSTMGLPQVPDYVELKDENFFILSFEHKRREMGKSEKGFGELKQQKTGNSKKGMMSTEKDTGEVKGRKTKVHRKLLMQWDLEDKENKNALNSSEENHQASKAETYGRDRLKDSVESYCPLKDDDLALVEAKPRQRRKKRKTKRLLGSNEECESCSHEDSSPVSVLDFDRFLVVQEPAESESEKSLRLEEPSLRRKLSAELEVNEPNHETVQEDWRRITKIGFTEFDRCDNNFLEMWLEICRINEAEMEESKWVHRELTKHEDFEELNNDIVSRVLDQLLIETIDQLASFTIVEKTCPNL